MVYSKISPNSPSLLSAFLKRSFALDTRVVYFLWLHNSSYAFRERAYVVRISPSSSTRFAYVKALFDILSENKLSLFPPLVHFQESYETDSGSFHGHQFLMAYYQIVKSDHFTSSPAEVFIFFSPL